MAQGSTNNGITNEVVIADDVLTNTDLFPVWATGVSGILPLYVSSSGLKFNPFLGRMTANAFSGPLTGNATSATALQTARTIDGTPFDGTSDITIIAGAINAATSKATPVDADEVGIADSASGFSLKKLTWANIKATLKTYFDTLYAPLNAQFTSTDQTITSGGLLTMAHGLPGTPVHIHPFLVCATAQVGYSVGDIVNLSGYELQANQGISIVPDATNLNIRFGSAASTFSVLHKSTGATSNVTNVNWRLRIYATLST